MRLCLYPTAKGGRFTEKQEADGPNTCLAKREPYKEVKHGRFQAKEEEIEKSLQKVEAETAAALEGVVHYQSGAGHRTGSCGYDSDHV